MISVLALDPGVMTGVYFGTVYSLDDEIVTNISEETHFSETMAIVDDVLTRADPTSLVVVAEKFTITAQTAKKAPQPASLEVIGGTKALLWRHGIGPDALVLQTPAAAKSMVSNDMLRDVDMWHVGGAGHANDAARHAVLYLLQHGWRPLSVIEALKQYDE